MAGKLHYTPQNGNSRRAAKSAARQGTPVARPAEDTPDVDTDVLLRDVSRQKNVKTILALGETRYISVRGLGSFAIPPVPFKVGQVVMDLYTETLIAAHESSTTGTKTAQTKYFSLLSRLAVILHKHIRPVGRMHHTLWRFGLTKNRFKQCSEQELKHITDFFLQGRMMSSVLPMSEINQTA